jgi:hypothetical protein
MENKNSFKSKYAKFYIDHIQNIKILYYFFEFIKIFIFALIEILQIIFIHFSLVFHNYSLILLGKFNKKFNIKFVVKFLIIFIIFLILSIILGVPRIYLI